MDNKPNEVSALSVVEHLKIRITEKNSNTEITTNKVCVNKRV
jgi:hypothetical protein